MALAARATRTLLAALDSVAARVGAPDERPQHHILGERGEDVAYFYLRERGYTIVARNFRSPRVRGELDLIAWQRTESGDTLCFIEVKTRAERDERFTAESAVDFEKRRDLRRIAREYLRSLPNATPRPGRKVVLPPTRFDVVTVYISGEDGPQIELIPAAFGW
jgi:putative endonuclease